MLVKRLGNSPLLLQLTARELEAISEALRLRAFKRHDAGQIGYAGYISACNQAKKYKALADEQAKGERERKR